MRIECVTVCRGYADFLAEVLPHNLAHFDDYVVVTSFDDSATQSLCRELGVECRPTDLFDKGGDPFAKGRAIDWGLGFLRRDAWICHLDADIYLPPMTRHWIEASEPDERCIYGCDRVNCVGFDAWRKFIAGGSRGAANLLQHRQHCLLTPPPFPLGARLTLRQHGGYVPIGFFQLWHGAGGNGRRYPLRQGNAEHTDVLHALQWPRDKRRLLEELIAVHLVSAPGRMGRDWNGRTSPRFGPSASQPRHGNGERTAEPSRRSAVPHAPAYFPTV